MQLKSPVALVALSCWSALCWGQSTPRPKDADNGFHTPKIELRGKLSQIFTVTGCEYISGLTCRIHYNGALPLPSEVFFTEFDERGRQAGPQVRLIYPELKRGETGAATLRIRSSRPAKIVLQGEWNGPWRDPY